MGSANELYSYNPRAIDIGVVTGTVTATQLPSGTVKLIRFKANSDNEGSFFVGETEHDLFYEMRARDDTGWIPITNMNELYHINLSGTSDLLYYWRMY